MNDDKFVRTEILLGTAAMERLKSSTVAVFGIGGVGSFAVEALARAGVGHLILIDHDVVDVTNINRQLHATTKTAGKSKTELMKARILDINPAAIVDTVNDFYLPTNEAGTDKFFICDYDYVIDAIDTVTGKIGLVLECKRRSINTISSMGAGNKLDPTQFKVGDIFSTSVDPIAKVMRKKLKEHGVDALKVVYSTEKPRDLDSEALSKVPPSKKIIGSISFVPSVAGLILAGEVIKELAGVQH